MAKKTMSAAQLRRRLKDTAERIDHERSNVSATLRANGFTQKEADYLTTRAQKAPSEVMKVIEAKAPDEKVAGKVRRCVNLIKKLNGNYWRFTRQAQKQGV